MFLLLMILVIGKKPVKHIRLHAFIESDVQPAHQKKQLLIQLEQLYLKKIRRKILYITVSYIIIVCTSLHKPL